MRVKPLRQHTRHREIEIDEPFPRSHQYFLESRNVLLHEWSSGVCLPDAGEMLLRPVGSRVNGHIEDARLVQAAVPHGNGQPQWSALRLDAVAISPSVRVVLDIVVVEEHIGTPPWHAEP